MTESLEKTYKIPEHLDKLSREEMAQKIESLIKEVQERGAEIDRLKGKQDVMLKYLGTQLSIMGSYCGGNLEK